MKQLSSTAEPPGLHELVAIAESPATTLFIATPPSGDIVGMLTLVLVRIPTGVRAIIEDVVVSPEFRQQGIGDALLAAAIESAKASHARSIDLTSRPSRVGAHRLYLRQGFTVRETSVYRYAEKALGE